MIKAQIIGYLGKDAQVNNVNGNTVINFSVAHTEKYNNAAGTKVEKTTWVDCSYWTEKTAIAPYLKKGTLVYLEGAPDSRAFLNQDNKAGSSLTLRVAIVQLLGNPATAEGKKEYTNQETEDLPF